MKLTPIKAILSSLLLLTFLYLAFSGALLHFGKTGMVLGFARYALRNTHSFAAAFICVLIPLHLFLNRRLYFKELSALACPKDKEKRRAGNEKGR